MFAKIFNRQTSQGFAECVCPRRGDCRRLHRQTNARALDDFWHRERVIL